MTAFSPVFAVNKVEAVEKVDSLERNARISFS